MQDFDPKPLPYREPPTVLMNLLMLLAAPADFSLIVAEKFARREF